MGPARTQLGAVHEEDRQQNRPTTKWAPGSWRSAFKKFRWQERAEAWDEHRRKEIFNRGFASDLVRIEKLDKLATRLEEKVHAMFDAMKAPRGGFNELMIGRYLEALDALAKETGGRVQKKEIAGPNGGPLEVLLFLPEQEHDDPLAGSHYYSQDDTIEREDGDLLAGGDDDE